MEITFIKLPGNRHVIEVRGRAGPDIRRPPRETGPTIPHDLAHAAVEEALDLHEGFWESIRLGATYEDFEPLGRGRHRRSGLKVLRKMAPRVMEAEMAVSWAHRVWSGQRTEGRGLGPAPLGEADVMRACAALDRARALWDALPEGQALTWQWTPLQAGKHKYVSIPHQS